MKVTFIYPDLLMHRLDWSGYYYAGIASISAVLKENGFETSLIHITSAINRREFLRRVEIENPSIIAFSATSHMFPYVREYAGILADAGICVPTICGGIHPTIAPEEAIAVKGIGSICRGEGEFPQLEYCRNIRDGKDITRIENLWVKQNGEVIRNPLRPPLEDLDQLPVPDRTLFDYPNLYSEREGKGCFLISRGCPFSCTYCCNHLIRKIYGNEGKTTRFRSVDRVIKEIKAVLAEYPFINKLVFDDDILFLRRDWSEEFTEKYRREVGLPFICNARANLVDERIVELFKKAGCAHVKFGLESGDEYISSKVLNRQLTNDHIRRAFALCRNAGLVTESFNMVGVPHETPATILNTIKLNASIGVDRMQVSIFQPYQGTRLYDLCRDEGFLVSSNLDSDIFSPSVLTLPTIHPSQILMFRDYFKVLVRYYQLLLHLPSGLSGKLCAISDKIISAPLLARILNQVYIPLNRVFRKLQLRSTHSRIISRGSCKPETSESRAE